MKSFLRQIEESFQSLNEKDWDGDGEQETPEQEYMGVKDRAIKKAMNPECDSCYGGGCDDCKNTGMKPEYQNVEQCTKCKGEGCDHCDGKGYHEKVDEMSTTAGVAPVTGKYFIDPDKKEKQMKYEQVQAAMDRKYEQLIEGYRTFVTGNPKLTPEQKVNNSIKEVATQLKTIEEIVSNTARLKNESGIAHGGLKESSRKALTKISERLIKISERVRSLGE
jgi:hypothetical protein